MKRRTLVSVLLGFFAAMALPVAALADVSVVRGQFTDRVEAGRPVGDAAAARASGRLVYHLVMNNTGEATTVTVVWKINGREVRRQSLDVGRAPRWRTWATQRASRTAQVEVQVLDAAGASIHTETLAQ